MADTGHTYGPSCSLQTDSNIFMRRASVASYDPPKVRAQFFYNSALPIDDPLSPVPLPSSNSIGPSKFPPRPFSVFDNTALEETWQSLQALERAGEKRPETTRSSHKDTSTVDTLKKIVNSAAQEKRSGKKSKSNLSVRRQDEKSKSRTSLVAPISTAETATAETLEDQDRPQPQQVGDPHLMLCDDPSHVPFDETMPVSSDEIGNDEFESGISKKRHRSPFRRKDKVEKAKDKEDAKPRRRLSMQKKKPGEESYGSSPLERNTTGTPFIRVTSRRDKSQSHSSDHEADPSLSDDSKLIRLVSDVGSKKGSRPASIRDNNSEHWSFRGPEPENDQKSHPSSRRKQKDEPQASVAVGVSRLHLVKMPDLKVGAIDIFLDYASSLSPDGAHILGSCA